MQIQTEVMKPLGEDESENMVNKIKMKLDELNNQMNSIETTMKRKPNTMEISKSMFGHTMPTKL